MTIPAFVTRAALWRRVAWASLLACTLTGHIAQAEGPSELEIASARPMNDEFLRLLAARLERERTTLDKLERLRSRGQATWREVAQQQVMVDSLMAERKAASEFFAYLEALRIRAARAEQDSESESESAHRNCYPTLQNISLQLAAAEAKASGELRVAEVALRREELRLTALERLRAGGHASLQELDLARQNVRAAQSLVERLTSERADRIRTYDKLLRASGQSLPSDCKATLADEDVRPESIPTQVFDHSSGTQRLLELHHARCATDARAEAITARRAMLEELLHRLNKAPHRSASLAREIESTRLDAELAQAEEQAAKEQIALLRLKEVRLVALCVEQPRSDELVTAATPGPFATVSNPSNGDAYGPSNSVRRASSIDSQRMLPPRDRQAIAWPMPGQSLHEVLGNSSRRTIHFSEPAYHDYYEFGIRRTDLPPAVRSTFAIGSIPWYLPGSPTNFR